MTYFRLLRLEAIRQELMHAPPEVSVARIAHKFGFKNLGKFAADYREQFGEFPSRTLHSALFIESDVIYAGQSHQE